MDTLTAIAREERAFRAHRRPGFLPYSPRSAEQVVQRAVRSLKLLNYDAELVGGDITRLQGFAQRLAESEWAPEKVDAEIIRASRKLYRVRATPLDIYRRQPLLDIRVNQATGECDLIFSGSR